MDWKTFFRKRSVLIILLASCAVMIYGQSLRNDFVAWDDDLLVYQNPLVQEMTAKNITKAFTSYDPELYVPLTIVSFQIEHALFGFTPFFFHLDNLLLHIIAASLILILLERLGLERRTAFLGALIFIIHPINTETAAWTSARKDLLAAVFSLGTLLSYLQRKTERNARDLLITLGLFLLALFSKPVTIVLPVVFVLLDWKDKDRQARSSHIWIYEKLPFFLLSAIFLVIGLHGKQRNIGALGATQTILLAAKSTVFSIRQFFWPAELSPMYLQTESISITLIQFWLPAAIIVGAIITAVWSLRRTKVLLFSLLFFGLFLLPSFSNFAKDHSVYYFSDRYVYLSQIGILFLLGYELDRIMKKRPTLPLLLSMGTLGTIVASIFAWTAHAQSLIWKDSETLYRYTLAREDRSVAMHYNLGVLKHHRGDRAAALREYQKTLALDPANAKALNNRGIYYKEEGESDQALDEFKKAAAADPALPDSYNNIGSVLMDRNDIDGAIAEFRKAIAVRETFAQAHVNLAATLGRKGLYDEALHEYKRAFELAPQLLDGLPEIREALNLAP